MIAKVFAFSSEGAVSSVVDNRDTIPSVTVIEGFSPGPPTGSGAMKAAGGAYLTKDLGSPQTEVWLTFDFAFDSTALAYFVGTGAGYETFATLWTPSEFGIEWIVDTGPVWSYFGAGPPFTFTISDPAPVAATWQHIEYHYRRSDGVFEFYINGTLKNSHTPDDGPADLYNMQLVTLGLVYGDGNPDEAGVYYKNVKIGSTREGSEFLAENFTGDLSAWTVTGDCTIVDDPYPSFAMKSNGAAGDAYLLKDFGSPQATDVWLTFDMAFEPGALAYWDASAYGSGYFGDLLNADPTEIIAVYLNNALSWENNGVNGWTDAGADPVEGEWHHFEFHYEKATPKTEFYVDGTLLHTSTISGGPNSYFDIQQVALGQWYPGGDAAEIVYHKNVKIGTSREGSELLSEDFSGDLSAWDVTGDCTVVADPF